MLQTSPNSVHTRGGCFWDRLLPRVAAKFGSFPFKCLLLLPSSQPSPWRTLSAEPPPPRLPGWAQICGSRPRPAPGRWLWWLRWRCAQPSPEGRGPRAAQAGPAQAGVGRLGQGEDGRGAPGRERRDGQDPDRRPIRRCFLQVSSRGVPIVPTPPPPLRVRTRKCSQDWSWVAGRETDACEHAGGLGLPAQPGPPNPPLKVETLGWEGRKDLAQGHAGSLGAPCVLEAPGTRSHPPGLQTQFPEAWEAPESGKGPAPSCCDRGVASRPAAGIYPVGDISHY